MKPLQTSSLFAAALLLAAAGCRSTPKRESGPVAQPVAQSVSNPASATPAAKATPAPPDEPLIDADTTAGVRSSAQPVTIAVLSAGNKPVQAAQITVTDAKGIVRATGVSDDWGEFKPALSFGRYRVKAVAQGKIVDQPVKFDEHTQEIDLKLDLPPS